ncbi:hypothetical protein CONPUDRAFT_70324 [Coniophora puteana RWD-64-598 SS2]|uniref:Uncharacterized protein n=1 Tax=Coniophora puteana (strain RWD-64-598) TaxID=741705 RepID=A0A5M3N2D5_CONPW|nr:uncharacterized protein CONPUDRAFT_70324 [Coniophora puteana RWD-64-598 SS2]EIW85543.1 hypothetical protein CONPUDRAFT_70324 [Coniophora puteana RWD-64-598 SS2]
MSPMRTHLTDTTIAPYLLEARTRRANISVMWRRADQGRSCTSCLKAEALCYHRADDGEQGLSACLRCHNRAEKCRVAGVMSRRARQQQANSEGLKQYIDANKENGNDSKPPKIRRSQPSRTRIRETTGTTNKKKCGDARVPLITHGLVKLCAELLSELQVSIVP